MARHIDDVDRRQSRRRTVRLGSIIVAPPASAIPCVVVDRSAEGFRLYLHLPEEVPELFRLRLLSEESDFPCRTIWRGINEMGVEIIGASSN